MIIKLNNPNPTNIVAPLSRHKNEFFIMNQMLHADHSA